MTNAAVIEGDYANFRLVPSRKVVQVVIEIPIEKAAAFVRDFGMPDMEKGVPVALARLDQTVTAPLPPMPKEKKKWADMMPSAQAAIRCNEPGFWAFLNDKHGPCDTPKMAADLLRCMFKITSRAELDAGGGSYHLWQKLENDYHNWQRGYE